MDEYIDRIVITVGMLKITNTARFVVKKYLWFTA